MSKIEQQPSREEIEVFMSKLAEITVHLLAEQSVVMTEFEQGRETKLGVPHWQYVAAVQMKNAISCLFGTMADSLIYNDDRKPRLLVTESGEIDHPVMNAISFRYVADMDFPEFSVPLGKELKVAAIAGSVTAKNWQLVNGEGMTFYFQAIGEKPPMRVSPPRKRATVVRLF